MEPAAAITRDLKRSLTLAIRDETNQIVMTTIELIETTHTH